MSNLVSVSLNPLKNASRSDCTFRAQAECPVDLDKEVRARFELARQMDFINCTCIVQRTNRGVDAPRFECDLRHDPARPSSASFLEHIVNRAGTCNRNCIRAIGVNRPRRTCFLHRKHVTRSERTRRHAFLCWRTTICQVNFKLMKVSCCRPPYNFQLGICLTFDASHDRACKRRLTCQRYFLIDTFLQ